MWGILGIVVFSAFKLQMTPWVRLICDRTPTRPLKGCPLDGRCRSVSVEALRVHAKAKRSKAVMCLERVKI